MTINATSPVGSPATSNSTASSAANTATQTLRYNDFLTLLMAEIQNQDPTQPMDPSQMVSQLATVSEVGQAVQTNTTLASLLTATSLGAGGKPGRPDGRIRRWFDLGKVASVSVTNSGAIATLTNGQTCRSPMGRASSERRRHSRSRPEAIWMVLVGAGRRSARRWRSAS